MPRAKAKNSLPTPQSEITLQPITETIEKNYMPYVMSVIISRAIPDIDGFKPSHRKLLYTMYKMGLLQGPRTKSANVVGQTMHLNPHGDAAIYETLVRLTRGHEALLHPFIDSKGSFGKQYSRDMAYAASRYTEVKLDPICNELFSGIEKGCVDFVPNYDNTTVEPTLLPTTFPNILVSPNLGIAVGMACSICPFHLGEICDGTIALLKDPDLSEDRLLDLIKAPDFPGGGLLIYDREQMRQLYRTGVGSVRLRARYSYDAEQNAIDILQIPYSTSIEAIMTKIVDLIKDGKLRDVTDLRDAIDLNGFKLTLDLRKDADPDLTMEKLFQLTPLEDTFGCNFNILVEGTPRQMGVREILEEWISFRMRCVRRELQYDADKKKDRLHLLLGLGAILLDIDAAIRIIRNTEREEQVVTNLMEAFNLTEKQAEYIAEIKLRHLNREYIASRVSEIAALEEEIADLDATLADDLRIKAYIARQLAEIKRKYLKPRKTQLLASDEIRVLSDDDLIDSYEVRIFVTRGGYIKKITTQSFKANDEQKLKDGDEIVFSKVADNRDTIWCVSSQGRVYDCRINDLELTKASMLGEYFPAFLGMQSGERILTLRILHHLPENACALCFNQKGDAARWKLSEMERKPKRKIKPIRSFLSAAVILTEECDIALRTSEGLAMVFPSALVPLSQPSEKPEFCPAFSIGKNDKLLEATADPKKIAKLPAKCRKKSLPAKGVPLA